MAQSILAIDDSEEIHRLLDVRLRNEGLIIHHALNAEDGLAKARELQPDLILLDVVLPSTSGFALCRTLKEDPRTAHVPIIFLTGTSDMENKVAGLDLGATDYVTKPFDAAELCARVRSALRNKRCVDLLAAKAQLDALTGMWNRGYFNQRLSDELAATRRYGRKVTLIMLDIDHFKRINDEHGHPVGDRVLVAVGEVLSSSVRTADAPCRYGGEEFAIILSETDLAGAMTVCERIQERLALLEVKTRDSKLTVTASIGVVSSECLERAANTPERLIESADDALYRAKQSGRNRTCVYQPAVPGLALAK